MTDDEYLALSPEEASRYWRQQNPAEQKRLLSLHLKRLKEPPPRLRLVAGYPKGIIGPLTLLAAFGLLIWGAASCVSRVLTSEPITKAEEYPGPWRGAGPAIYRAIYSQGHECVEAYVRASAKFRPDATGAGEYLVFCHDPATKVWLTYLVWPSSNRVIGPDLTFAHTSGVPLPERHPDAVWMDTAP
jgi:hypothetical protein